MKRFALCSLVLLTLTGCAGTPASSTIVVPVAPAAPEGITWQKLGMTDYEPQAPGLGRSFRFQSSIGWIDLYQYSLGRSDWRDGTADAAFEDHFRSVLGEVRGMALRGIYENVALRGVHDEDIGAQHFRHAVLTYRARGREVESHILLTGWHGQLLKYRMSFPTPVLPFLDDEIHRFVGSSLQELQQADTPTARPPAI